MVQGVVRTYWPNPRELVDDPDVRDWFLQSINGIQATSGFITGSPMADTEHGASWDELTEARRLAPSQGKRAHRPCQSPRTVCGARASSAGRGRP
jgi:hypothetical protein